MRNELECSLLFVRSRKAARSFSDVIACVKLLRALIVSPDEAARRQMAWLLDERCFDCVEADDGIAALEHVSPGGIDLIVVDFNLPRLGGAQLLDIVIAGAFGCTPPPMIMCTTSLHERVWVHRLELPGVASLSKPFNPIAFVEALDAAFPVD